jgi:selenocysteine-specific elongation factor
MTTKTVAILGHVDHGKTALVKALTGIETDTLAQERERGLTISLGFAPYRGANGTLNLIDAPGHADFIRTSISALSGIDAAILTISARDGIQAQTHEHLKAAKLLQVDVPIVVITKRDMASSTNMTAIKADIVDLFTQYDLKAPIIVTCTTVAPIDIIDVTDALDTFLNAPEKRPTLAGFYLPIDRTFSKSGSGTIVTGTLIGHSLNVGDTAHIAETQYVTLIRALQVNGAQVQTAYPGDRVAVNLRNAALVQLKTGQVLTAPDAFMASTRFDIALDKPSPHTKRPPHMAQITVLHGTTHASARLRYFDHAVIDADRTVYAQIEYNTPQTAYSGQRLILRQPASAELLIGATILDPNARRITRAKTEHIQVLHSIAHQDPSLIATHLAHRDKGIIDLRELARLSGQTIERLIKHHLHDFQIVEESMAVDKSALVTSQDKILSALQNLHDANPIRPHFDMQTLKTTMPSESHPMRTYAIKCLQSAGRIRLSQSQISLCNYDPNAALTAQQKQDYERLDHTLKAMALMPDHIEIIASTYSQGADLIDLLIYNKRAIQLYNYALNQAILIHLDAVTHAQDALKQTFPNATHFTTSEARKALNTNRKTIVPLLEYFDKIGFTARTENGRYIP